ncbi:MAG: hypothetical protein KJ622_06250 [Alphaproteobacteria bacterium]|nr:hypothetical protein [Alphaproteobacteria bacterium]
MSARSARQRTCAPLNVASPTERDNADAQIALRALSRRDAIAVEADEKVQVVLAGCSSPEKRTDISDKVWDHLKQRGWCVPLEAEKSWRISNAGRIALKRLLSRKGAPHEAAVSGGRFASASSPPPSNSRRGADGLPRQNDNESPLAWLRQRRDRQGRSHITETQFSAGEHLRRDFTYGNLSPNITSNWSPVAFGSKGAAAVDRELELRDGQLRARERFRAAMAAVGPEFSGVLADVCCFLLGLEEIERKNGWPRRTAKIVLGLGLSALARFYGMDERRSCSGSDT